MSGSTDMVPESYWRWAGRLRADARAAAAAAAAAAESDCPCCEAMRADRPPR